MMNPRKVAVIGCGFVGASIAFGPHAERTVFRDGAHRCQSRKSGGRGDGFKPRSSLHGVDGHLCRGLQGRGGLRTDHYYRGSESETGRDASGSDREECRDFKIDRSAITATAFEGILMIVANPVDVLTYAAQQISGYPVERVFGSGTVLDTARLKYRLADIWMWTAAAFMPLSSVSMATATSGMERGECVRNRSESFLRTAGTFQPRGIHGAPV